MIYRLSQLIATGFLLGTGLLAHAANPNYRSPETVDGATTVTAAEANALISDGALAIDVRNPRLHARRHIPGAHHLDLKHAYTEEALSAIASAEQPLVIYCSGVKCVRSSRASRKAVEWGFTNVYYFRGGIVEWRDAGYPTESSPLPETRKSSATDT